jgi:LmbE family N-acetylglucosaminyl deacetylase
MDAKNRLEAGIVKEENEIIIERPLKGKPYQGKVLAAIQAHADDIPLFAGGLVAKLMDEGYTGYLIRTCNDDKGDPVGNEIDNKNIAKAYGMEKAFDFNYSNHQMDNMGIQDLKGRLVFLFRLLKVDTIVSWDPWVHYEENYDHVVTAQAVEMARWHVGGSEDYPEHFDAGLKPHSPKVRYYYSRDPKRINRIVDISGHMDKKVQVNMLNVTQGPAGQGNGKRMRDELAAQGKRLPLLEGDDRTANANWVKHFLFDVDAKRLNFGQISNKELGEQYGLEWAERYFYISSLEDQNPNKMEKYVKEKREALS